MLLKLKVLNAFSGLVIIGAMSMLENLESCNLTPEQICQLKFEENLREAHELVLGCLGMSVPSYAAVDCAKSNLIYSPPTENTDYTLQGLDELNACLDGIDESGIDTQNVDLKACAKTGYKSLEGAREAREECLAEINNPFAPQNQNPGPGEESQSAGDDNTSGESDDSQISEAPQTDDLSIQEADSASTESGEQVDTEEDR